MRPCLAKRKIVAQHFYVRFAESIRYRYQKGGITIRSRAVGEK